MTTRILIARHGNTFTSDQTPTRVGGRTDLELTEEERARAIGKYLKSKDIMPDVVFAAPLKRTFHTAELACEELGFDKSKIVKDESFREIDYGPDENKTEEEVMLRLGNGDLEKGQAIIDAWNKDTTVPNGWLVNPQDYIDTWIKWGKKAETEYKDKTVMIVSSNGIMRFAPHLTGAFDEFVKDNGIKVTTGGLCIFEKEEGDANWTCVEWNTKCKKVMEGK